MNLRASLAFTMTAIASLSALGCSSSDTSGAGGKGTSTEAPRADVEYAAGPIAVQAGEDTTVCTYVRSDSDEDRDIIEFITSQSEGGHHLIVYTIDHAVDLAPHKCSQGGQPSWTQVLATQLASERISFPEGVGFRVKAHQQYVMETHFINTTSEALDVTSKFGVRYAAPGTVKERAATYFFGTMNIDIPPNASYEKSALCRLPKPMNIRTMFGHQHRMGVELDVHLAPQAGPEEMLYQSKDWEAPEIKPFESGLAVGLTDHLRVTCNWNNTSSSTLRYPHEMCFAIGYFWPADNGVFCASGGGNDTCHCQQQGTLDTGPGGAAIQVSLTRKASIPGSTGVVDKGAPIYCALYRAEDYTPFGPKEGAQAYYFRDAVDVALTDDKATAEFDIQDVTPGDYAVSCVMDVIGGGFIPGSGDLANATAPTVSVKKGDVAHVDVVLDFAIP